MTNPALLTSVDGKMSSAYKVTPAEPVSKASGILTGCDPTAVTMMKSRGPVLKDWTGYRSMVIERETVPVGVGGGAGDREPFDPPPHAATARATDAIDPIVRLILSSLNCCLS